MSALNEGWLDRLLGRLRDDRLAQLLKNLFVFSGSTTLAQIIMMGYVLILARVLGPERYGAFNSAYALVGLSAIFLNLGMDLWYLRQAGLGADIRKLSGTILTIKAIIGLAWGAVLVGLMPVIRPDLYPRLLMLIAAVDSWSDVCFNTEIQAFNTQRRMKLVAVLMMVSRGGRLLSLAALALLGVRDLQLFALFRAAATVLSLVLATVALKPVLGLRTFSARHVLRESVPYGLSELLSLIYTNADVTILALMRGTTAVGLYSSAAGVIHAMYIVPNAIFTVILPILSRMAARDPRELRASFKRLFLGFGAAGLVLWLGIGVIGAWLLPVLLGKSYQPAADLLALLSPILFLKSLGFACAAILVAVGWQQKRLWPQLVSAFLSIFANLIVIPRYGMVGVSWVYIISEAALTAAYAWLAVRWLRETPHGGAEAI